MVRKIRQFLYLVLLIGAVLLAPINAQAYSAPVVENTVIKPDEALHNVTITGSVSTGESRNITVKVTDSKEVVVFVDQVKSSSNGSFACTFKQSVWTKGEYFVKIGGDGIDTPYEGTYEITTDGNTDISDVTANLDKSAGKVTLSGTVKSGEGKYITVKVFNPNDTLVFLDQVISGPAGKFNFSFKLNNWITGKYVYQMGGEGMNQPYQGSFDIASNTGNGDSGGSTNTGSTSTNVTPVPTVKETSITVNTIDGNKVSIDYTLKSNEDPNKVIVYYINADGTKKIVKNGRYSALIGKVELTPGKTGKYIVGYNDIKFDDVSASHWASNSINGLAAREIISGVGNNKFNPSGKITRAEFLKILMESFDLIDSGAKCTLSGVEENAWYYSAIASAQKFGIIAGKMDGSFGANEEVTRQDMALMIYKTSQVAKLKLNSSAQSKYFKDENSISDYAVEAVKAMQRSGIVSGFKDGSFAPKNGATRAEGATMIYKLLFNN